METIFYYLEYMHDFNTSGITVTEYFLSKLLIHYMYLILEKKENIKVGKHNACIFILLHNWWRFHVRILRLSTHSNSVWLQPQYFEFDENVMHNDPVNLYVVTSENMITCTSRRLQYIILRSPRKSIRICQCFFYDYFCPAARFIELHCQCFDLV